MLKRDGNLVIRLTDMNDRKERYIDAVEGLLVLRVLNAY